MKRQVILSLGIVGLLTAATFAGSLNPPAGPVGPTMKPLSEIEPRIAVGPFTTPGDANSLYVIDKPGSYYLTDNMYGQLLKDGIRISSNAVVLDLNGFAMVQQNLGQSVTEKAITIADGYRNIRISNGSIQGWLMGVVGIGASGITCTDIQISAEFGGERGFYLGSSVRFERCTVSSMAFGFTGTDGTEIDQCAAYECGVRGFEVFQSSKITNSVARNCTQGFYAQNDAVINHCAASFCDRRGIWVENRGQISNCTVSLTPYIVPEEEFASWGIGIESFGQVSNCTVTASGKDYGKIGIHSTTGGTISNCTVSNCWMGIDTGDGNTILDCTARANGECGIAANNQNVIMRCNVSGSDQWGIWVRDKSIVKDCVAANNGNVGIDIRCCGQGCRIESNLSSGNSIGIHVEDNAGHYQHQIFKNTCGDNGTNYDLGNYSSWGPIVDLSSTYGDISTVSGAEHPLANFAYSLSAVESAALKKK